MKNGDECHMGKRGSKVEALRREKSHRPMCTLIFGNTHINISLGCRVIIKPQWGMHKMHPDKEQFWTQINLQQVILDEQIF